MYQYSHLSNKCEVTLTTFRKLDGAERHRVAMDHWQTHRLINPAKSNIGRISKNILENINRQIRLKYNLNQWRSTDQALEWFSNIDSKTRKVLLQLDIVDFYPSISEDLFNKALDFADTICTISDSTRKILKNARKSLLFSDGATWQKKNRTT